MDEYLEPIIPKKTCVADYVCIQATINTETGDITYHTKTARHVQKKLEEYL